MLVLKILEQKIPSFETSNLKYLVKKMLDKPLLSAHSHKKQSIYS